ATAEVARAVGVQGTIIGPTHAISAALTNLKGAARLVARSTAGGRGGGEDRGGGAWGQGAERATVPKGGGGERGGGDEGEGGKEEGRGGDGG
ncbi:unnamed protein product, partial [Discosporangium mesarthrocarpum]